jgi:diguanylate cyclase (GGDEF)-like protein/putative nucleotidyltransferase with HDIG domain
VPTPLSGEFGAAEAEPGAAHPLDSLSRTARFYLVVVVVGSLGAALPTLARLGSDTHRLTGFAALAACAAFAQLYVVVTPRHQAYHASIVFMIAAALTLPPELVALVGVVAHVPEWLKLRYPWFIQVFNISNFTIDGLAAWGTAHLIMRAPIQGDLRFALAGLAACTVFVVLNHLLLSTMLLLGRGHSFRASGLFGSESLSTDFVLAVLGVGIAGFWHLNIWLIPAVIAPLILIQRSLAIPVLLEQARVDSKTGLFNARHFADALNEELIRAERFGRPLSVLMADLDLLRDINNTYGHLAGDSVLIGIAEIFRAELRDYDVPARFGGEEFSILLPETLQPQALEIAERIRRAVAERGFEVETSEQPIHATLSIGVATYPEDGIDANQLLHQADLAVYRAKVQGRNRVLAVSSESLTITADHPLRVATPLENGDRPESEPAVPKVKPQPEPAVPKVTRQPEPAVRKVKRQSDPVENPRPRSIRQPRFLSLPVPLATMVGVVSVLGIGAGITGTVFGSSHDVLGLIAVVALVGAGQALSLGTDDGTISVAAVGSLAAASLFGLRGALAVAFASAIVEWSSRRQSAHYVLFNIGVLTLATLAAVGVFTAIPTTHGGPHDLVVAMLGVAAGATYFAVNMSLVSLAMAMEGHARWWAIFKERFGWLLTHYLVYGFVGAVMAIAYDAAGLYALAVFAVPLMLMRRTQAAYLTHTQRSVHKLREAAETIQSQNVSLEEANRLLKERSTAAMQSLAATVDARDAYTAGHSRRVQRLALEIGRELGLSQAELDLLGHAALFHDIGKLGIPDAILLKPSSLTADELSIMQRHSEDGAQLVARLGFLDDAVPLIRHHHERYDGNGYPAGLAGEGIPFGARIIHVADALDSMLTNRVYRSALSREAALEELEQHTGTQFCPRAAGALTRVAFTAPELRVPSLA